jgi:type I restriction enzyme, S subunit
VEDGYPVVRPRDVREGPLDLTGCSRTTHEEFVDLTESYSPRQGDVVYSRNASFGIAAIANSDAPFAIGQDTCLISGDRLSGRFLFYLLNGPVVRTQLDLQSSGSTFKRINLAAIRCFLVPVVPEDEQEVIISILAATDEYIYALSRLQAHLQRLKQALMSALLSGEIRVTPDEVVS